MTKRFNRILIKSLFLASSSIGVMGLVFQRTDAHAGGAKASRAQEARGVVGQAARESAWNQDQILLQQVLQARKNDRRLILGRTGKEQNGAARAGMAQVSLQGSPVEKLKQLEFDYTQALEQKDLNRLDQIKDAILALFPSYRWSAEKKLLEAHLRFEDRQLGASLELVRSILRDPQAHQLYPRALLLRAQAFRDLGLETAALGTYDLLKKKFPRTPQAELGDLEAKVIRLSVNK